MFQIVAFHDFELEREGHDHAGLDWGIFQIEKELEAHITRCIHVDVFYSLLVCAVTVSLMFCVIGSLVLPTLLPNLSMETCAEFGVEWERRGNLRLNPVLPSAEHDCQQITDVRRDAWLGPEGILVSVKRRSELCMLTL